MKVIGFTIATLCLSLISNGQNLCFTNPVYSPVAGGASYINRCGVADFNSDGQPDFAQPTNGGSNVYLCLSSGTNTYLAVSTITTTSNFNFLITGDFNNDTKQDIGLMEYDSNKVAIKRGNGAGTFTSTLKYSVGIAPFRAVRSDFNNDGFTDIATANFGSNDVSILINNTSGGFFPAVSYSSTNQATYIFSADFNNDGAQDLFVSGAFGSVVLKNNGNGTFQLGSALSMPMTCSFDLNNDGLNDLFGIGSNSLNISINQGGFIFSTPTLVSCGFSSPVDIDPIDANSDGKKDLIVIDYSFLPGKYSVHLNNGTGGFLAPIVFTTTANLPKGVQTLNVDNNGTDDFIMECDNSPNVHVFLNCLTTNVHSINNEDKEIYVYPSVSNGFYQIKNPPRKFSVIDFNGNEIIKGKEEYINLSNYPNGIYFLRVEAANGEINNFKLIKTD